MARGRPLPVILDKRGQSAGERILCFDCTKVTCWWSILLEVSRETWDFIYRENAGSPMY